MNFYPDWLKTKREQNQKKFKLLLLVLVLLALVHYFFIFNKQSELQSEQARLTQSLELNQSQLIASQGLSNELKLLSDRLRNKKILFSAENTQIIIESINDLLISNGAQMVQVSLNNDNLLAGNYLNSNLVLDEPIGISARFIIRANRQFEIINQIIQSPYLFAINQINRDEAGMFHWQIGIPTRKQEDINENNLRQVTKLAIFPNLEPIESNQVIEAIEIVEVAPPPPPPAALENINCNLPRLEGIFYQQGNNAMIFLNGEILRLNQTISCYQITAILPQSIELTDPNGEITELFTNPNQ